MMTWGVLQRPIAKRRLKAIMAWRLLPAIALSPQTSWLESCLLVRYR